MRKFLIVAACAMLALIGSGARGELDAVGMAIDGTVSSNAMETATNGPVWAYVEAIEIDLGGSSAYAATMTVSVVTDTGNPWGVERVLYTNAALLADVTVPVRDVAEDNTGTALSHSNACRYVLFGEKLVFRALSNTTNITAKARVLLCR